MPEGGLSYEPGEPDLIPDPCTSELIQPAGGAGGAGEDDDALGVGRALVLADAAAGAGVLVDDDAVVEQFDRGGADGAVIEAHAALFAVRRADARVLAPVGRAHVDVAQRGGEQRPAGAVLHTVEARAEHAGHRVYVDVRRPLALAAAVVQLDALGRADAHAGAAPAARLA